MIVHIWCCGLVIMKALGMISYNIHCNFTNHRVAFQSCALNWMPRGGIATVGSGCMELLEWKVEKFFRMGWGCDEPPVVLIEDDCAA